MDASYREGDAEAGGHTGAGEVRESGDAGEADAGVSYLDESGDHSRPEIPRARSSARADFEMKINWCLRAFFSLKTRRKRRENSPKNLISR